MALATYHRSCIVGLEIDILWLTVLMFGSLAISKMAKEPNIRTVNHRMSISSPTMQLRWQMANAAVDGDVFEQPDNALQHE